jgi:hypothetical protein
MDGHLRTFAIFFGELHAPKFTDCYWTKQPQFAAELFSQRLMPTNMMARTASANEKCLEHT